MNYDEIVKSANFSRYRQEERGEMLRKIFDMFMANFDVTSSDFTTQEIHYLMKELYYKGTVCVLKKPDGTPLVCPYASTTFNNNDYPVTVTYINHRGLPGLFPDNMTGVNLRDCVIGFIRPTWTPIYRFVEHQVNKIVDVDVTMQINLFSQKLPFLIGCDPSDVDSLKHLMRDMASDKAVIYTTFNELKKAQTFEGSTFNIDKLRQEKVSLTNELLTQLGIDNNNQEKKAQLLSDEVNSNNDEIKKFSDIYIKCLSNFAKDIKETLGFDISFKWNGDRLEEIEEPTEDKDDE